MRLRHAFVVLGLLVASATWISAASAAVPDPTQSFYVPQAGLDYSNPMEGAAAIEFFRACPNNEGGTSLPLAARIKLVVRDASGAPISGISRGDLCILFNGGTAAQGFSGSGADSVIANGTWNQNPLCPDVRCIPADAPTDAEGVAYITFTGPGGVRDPARKWGHYDTELPVYALGIKIPGRLTSTPGSEAYVLRIKNFDISQPVGLSAVLNAGERVNVPDINQVAPNAPGGPGTAQAYWCDFNSDGVVDLTDCNIFRCHIGHDCAVPLNP